MYVCMYVTLPNLSEKCNTFSWPCCSLNFKSRNVSLKMICNGFSQNWCKAVSSCSHTHTHNHITAPFLGPPGWAGARRELLDFMVQRKINRGRHTDHPAGRHFIRTNQCRPPPSPIFLQAGCPSCRPTNSVKALKATSAFGLGRRR